MSIFILMIKDSTEVYGYSDPQVGMHVESTQNNHLVVEWLLEAHSSSFSL